MGFVVFLGLKCGLAAGSCVVCLQAMALREVKYRELFEIGRSELPRDAQTASEFALLVSTCLMSFILRCNALLSYIFYLIRISMLRDSSHYHDISMPQFALGMSLLAALEKLCLIA
ncbi:hypothetical protein KQX54_008407 [Cotesia glomerata]|uniref:Olfactory receptor n=1 Tax=Cotesia glomerata TaxID=32391 RepID=A0AAV7I1Y6_COTGL|nr:hypothetical protein KQX54_008407 [Cotesia glomerata]